MPVPPPDEYRARLARLRAARDALVRRDRRLSAARLLVFAAALLVAAFWWRGAAPVWWAALPLAAFALLVHRHDRVIRARDAAARSIAFYERGLARIEDRWIGTGEPGDRFGDDHHPYAADLDLFGPGSLFELLSVARTRAGEEALADWLARPAPAAEIRLRQEAVSELASALDLREALALAGADVRAGVDTTALVAWASAAPVLRGRWRRAAAAALTCLAVATAAYGFASGRYAPFIAVAAMEALFSIPQRRRVEQALHAAEGPARDLDVLAHVLACLERGRFSAPRLAALRGELEMAGLPASAAIGRLRRLVELHDWQHNQFFAPVAAALLWGTHLAWAIEGWRRVHGVRAGGWLRTVGEFEALSSLAAYRYEHPADAWPDIVEGGARFDARALGHPLIPAARMVPNDVRLADAARLLVVSGSNMSGKSTLLRTVGINAVLAQAGAPVRAAELRLTPLAVGATLRIQDSLQEGRSRFYAEITRLRQLADLAAGPAPLLFLLDELFQGTNSHDRLIGAAGLLGSLLDRGAIGLITTHDLALTAIAGDLAPRALNVHFEDAFEGGEMRFDYRLKPGPVTRSNAIALMRAVGLDIDRPER
ncbi:MAG: DNA mismatch repair protein MutS [Acidobacteria bacterium]|nr:DNA mismatch repair protein MutS [Acidobacteriota bacterium]